MFPRITKTNVYQGLFQIGQKVKCLESMKTIIAVNAGVLVIQVTQGFINITSA